MLNSSEIRAHPLMGPNGDTIVQQALQILRRHLPISISVYRRLQFGRFFPDTTLLTSLPSLDSAGIQQNEPWIIAFVDRTGRPETEVWWFASWEAEVEERMPEDQVAILHALFTRMNDLPIPESLHQDVLDAAEANAQNDVKDHSGVSRSDYSAHLLDPAVVLCGAIHETSLPALQRTGLVKHVFEAGLVPNHTFIFDIDENLPAGGQDLPDGLTWGELRPEHFVTVRARTQIPRQDKTLAVLPNLAIYKDETPIAWVFVGLDGSLTTLHVEEGWRGKGLAKAITTKLFREKMNFLWEEGVSRLSHGYVTSGNDNSAFLCESLGGMRKWDSYWVRVDLARLRSGKKT